MTNPALRNLAVALLSTTVIVPSVAAQDGADEKVTSVYERYREDFSARGVRSGSFLFYPKIDATAKYDSNIYAQDGDNPAVADLTDDFVAIVKPGFSLASDWNNNSFNIQGGAEIGRYMDETDEDYEDYNISANGRVDITRGTSVSMNASYSQKHEDRGSVETNNNSPLAGLVEYDVLSAGVGFKRDEGMFSLAIDGNYTKNDYDPTAQSPRSNRRDREQYQGSVRVGYDLNEDYEAFVKFTTTAVDYRLDNLPTSDRVLKDSDGWAAVGGAAFNVGGKSEGEVYVGYVKRDYDNVAFDDVSDIKFGASVLWNPTGLTSVRVAVDRDVVETIVSDARNNPMAGILSTRFSGEVEHELQRNLLLRGKVSFNKMDYIESLRANAQERNDDVFNAGIGAKYLMNRNLAVNFDYSFDKRNSDQDELENPVYSDYTRHAFIVSLSAQW